MADDPQAVLAYARTILEAVRAVRGDGATVHRAAQFAGILVGSIPNLEYALMRFPDEVPERTERLKRNAETAQRWLVRIVAT